MILSTNSIIVKEGLCNTKQDDLMFVNYPHLESFHVEKKTLQNLRSLIFSDNPHLSSISFGDYDESDDGIFMNVKNVTISSIIQYYHYQIDLPKLQSFITPYNSFTNTEILIITSILYYFSF